jgi:hypothetical protein
MMPKRMRSFDLPSMDWGGSGSAGFMHAASEKGRDKHITRVRGGIARRLNNPGRRARFAETAKRKVLPLKSIWLYLFHGN